MPERPNKSGLWSTPAATITRAASIRSPPSRRTPVARPALSSTRSTRASPRIVRFARPRAGARWVSAADSRRLPSRFIGIGPTPVVSGAFWSGQKGEPSFWQASTKLCCTGSHSASGQRWIRIGPSFPCHGESPKSRSVSSRRNHGSMSFQRQPVGQVAKSAGSARIATPPLIPDEPPTPRPRK